MSSPFSQQAYDAAAAAILALIQKEIPLLVPGWLQSFIPADKEPVVAAAAAKTALDAAAPHVAATPHPPQRTME
jgi:hypothetical protein